MRGDIYDYFGDGVIVLCVIAACNHISLWLNRRHLERRLESKIQSMGALLRVNSKLREEKKKLEAELDEKKADLIFSQTALQRFARTRGKNGRITGRAQ